MTQPKADTPPTPPKEETTLDLEMLEKLLAEATPGEGPDGRWFADDDEEEPPTIRVDLGSDILTVAVFNDPAVARAMVALHNDAPALLRLLREGEADAQKGRLCEVEQHASRIRLGTADNKRLAEERNAAESTLHAAQQALITEGMARNAAESRAAALEGALVRLLETQTISFSDAQAEAIDHACDNVLKRRVEPKEDGQLLRNAVRAERDALAAEVERLRERVAALVTHGGEVSQNVWNARVCIHNDLCAEDSHHGMCTTLGAIAKQAHDGPASPAKDAGGRPKVAVPDDEQAVVDALFGPTALPAQPLPAKPIPPAPASPTQGEPRLKRLLGLAPVEDTRLEPQPVPASVALPVDWTDAEREAAQRMLAWLDSRDPVGASHALVAELRRQSPAPSPETATAIRALDAACSELFRQTQSRQLANEVRSTGLAAIGALPEAPPSQEARRDPQG